VPILATQASAEEPAWYVREGTVACENPYMMMEALQAAMRNERSWFRGTNCEIVNYEQRVVILQLYKNVDGPWLVRLMGNGTTTYIPRSSLVSHQGISYQEYHGRQFDNLISRLNNGQAPF